MNKKLKRTLLSFAVAATMCVGAFAFAACDNDNTPENNNPPTNEETEDNKNTPVTPAPEVVTEKFKFTGTAEAEESDSTYNVSLTGYSDGTVELDTGVSGAKKIGGYYFYTEHKGYAFVLSDNAGTTMTSVYNEEEEQHEIEYTVTLGDDGSADVTLVLADADFEAVSGKATFYENLEFKGVSNEVYGITSNITLTLSDEDNTCTLTAEHSVFAGFCNTTGTYTFENNVFSVELEKGAIQSCTFDPVTGTYTLHYNLVGAATVDCDLTYTPDRTVPQQAAYLSGETSDGAHVLTFFLSDGTVRIAKATEEGRLVEDDANLDDKNGKLYFLNGQYIIIMEHGVFASTYANGEYTMEYTFASGIKVTLKGDALSYLVLEDYQPVGNGSYGNVNVLLYFIDEENCVIDVYAKLASMASMYDKTGTYVVNEDGSITVTVGETDYDITYDDETGTFSMEEYIVGGNDATAHINFTGALWAD